MSISAALFVLIFLAGIFLTLSRGPHWGFYTYQLIYFFNPGIRWWAYSLPSISYSFVTSILLITSFFIYSQKNNNKFSDIPFLFSFIFLTLLFSITYFYAISPFLHEKAVINFLKSTVVLAIAYKVLNDFNKLEIALIIYLVGAAYIGYEAYLSGRNAFGRVEGIGMVDAPEANGTAAAIVPAIPFLIFYFWHTKFLPYKLILILLGGLIINGLILINSRGAFLGAIVGGGMMLFAMYQSKISKQKLKVILLSMLGLFALLSITDSTFIDRMNTMSELEDQEKSGAERYQYWLIAIEMVKDYPFGTGAYGFDILSQTYLPPELFDQGKTSRAVHSLWFQSLSEVGWIGFILFFIVIYKTYKCSRYCLSNALKQNDKYSYFLQYAIFCSFISMLVSSSFINQFRVQIVYWCILFIIVSYAIMKNSTKEKTK
jgi:hypothetical protein